MKKFIALLLITVILSGTVAFGQNIPVETESECKAEITLPVEDIYVSDLIYLTLQIDSQMPIYAFEAKIEYDEDRVSYKEAEEDSCVIIENDEKGKLMFALSSVGEENLPEDKKGLYTFVFKAKKNGKTSFKLTDIILVFEDMTYYQGEDLDEKVSLKVKSLKGGGGSSGGGSSSSVSISKPVTSTGSDMPKEPDKKEEKKQNFPDVTLDYWGYESIQALFEKGVINGYEDGNFMPDNPVTRAEFGKIICKAFGILNDGISEVTFSDVSIGEWYYPYVATLSDIGVLKGEDGKFFPNREITREEAAAVIKRCGKYLKKDFKAVRKATRFLDDADISDYAKESIEELYAAGIINGKGNGCFMPKEKLVRAEAAKLIYNLLMGGVGND